MTRRRLRWLPAVAAAMLAGVCASDAAAFGTADDALTVAITDFGPHQGDDPDRYFLDYEYRMENHVPDAEIVRMTFEVFELTPELVGDEEYAAMFDQALVEVAEGRLGLQWSVEVQALDASGEVLGTSLLQSPCGTRGGESIEQPASFWLYEDGPAFAAEEVAEVVVDEATLEVLPLILSGLDEESCRGILSSSR
ncbi:hypothetical protein [Glycomyces tritici]|uniref:Uncharacterized protein n=1 Tax=Glycomyces tritici TaxID=2665176 RepID=A0ABT7YMB5_9ACTN|nr:hypothetical protein [Glycomyces tritici]MDN3239785.1 hypothetical protein [Glycomyces tritici]